MSEVVQDTAATTAPTSTTEAAESVIDAFEASETTGVESSGDTPVPTGTPTTTTETQTQGTPVQAPAKALSEAEQLLREAGFTDARRPDGRENRIPHSKVVKIIENGINQGKGAFGAKFQALESEATTLRGHLEQLRTGVSGDPKAFIAELASVDPRYRMFLEPAAPTAPQPAPDHDPMPPPDYDLGNGQRTYSVEGLAKRDEWVERQLLRKLDARVDERLKPITEREKAAQDRAKTEETLNDVRAQSQSQMQEAQTWPMFGALAPDGSLTEFQTQVLAELKKDSEAAKAAGRRPKLTLEGAYIKVIGPRFSEDENAKRARLLKEINAAPKSTAVPRTGGEAPRTGGAASTAEIAARTLDRLERGA